MHVKAPCLPFCKILWPSHDDCLTTRGGQPPLMSKCLFPLFVKEILFLFVHLCKCLYLEMLSRVSRKTWNRDKSIPIPTPSVCKTGKAVDSLYREGLGSVLAGVNIWKSASQMRGSGSCRCCPLPAKAFPYIQAPVK